MKYIGMVSKRTAGFCLLLLVPCFLLLAGAPVGSMAAELVPSVRPLDLTRAPNDMELISAGQLGGILNPTHSLRDARQSARVNKAFGNAIQLWNRHEYDRAAQLFEEHRTKYPESPWSSEAVLHLGCYAHYHGRYLDAEDSFNWVLEKNKGNNQPGARAIVNKSKLRLGVLRVAQDRLEEAEEFFRDLKREGHDWRHRTYAASWMQRLSTLKADKLALLNCGTKALAYLLKKRGNGEAAEELEMMKPGSLRGYSMEMLSEVSARYGLDLVAVKLPMEEVMQLSLPVIVYVTRGDKAGRGHYLVLDKSGEGELELLDPQSQQRFRQTPDDFAREWSGIALLFAEETSIPGVRLSSLEMREIFGGCCGVARSSGNTGNNRNCRWQDGVKGCQNGSPIWGVNMVNMNFYMADTPLWYSSPVGPSVSIALSYNSQSSTTYHEPFGNKWQFNYSSYLVVDPGGTVTIFMPDGSIDSYIPDGGGGYLHPYQVFNKLKKIAENHFELRFSDDTVHVYKIPSGTASMQPFLTQVRDAHGKSLNFGYNGSVQLTKITDAMGKVTSLTYNPQGLVSKVSDPFGRSADFLYDANRNLIQITDMGGYWSKLSYDADVYLTGLENSRGKWGFYTETADGINNGSTRYPEPGGLMWADYRITVTDPLGNRQEYYYEGYSGYSWYISPRDYVPYVDQSANNYRNAPKTRYDFVDLSQNTEISYITEPEGGTVWYEYDGNGNRSRIQDANYNTTTLAYNYLGRVASITDPKGVVTELLYADNGLDLLEVKNGLGSIIGTYNNMHDLASIRDRGGNPPWTFAYNSGGQMISATDPLGIVTEYLYNNQKQLVQVKRAGSVTDSFGYDAVGRVSSHTDVTGLKLTYAYNGLNQITKVTWPDGKFVEYTYSGCCPRLVDRVTDRSGKITRYTYDALQRLTRVTDPTGRKTSFLYDQNGNLTALVDPEGNTTCFGYDLNNRLKVKTYADGKSVSFYYDQAGLLTRRTNARGITAYYGYDENNNLETISYSDDTPDVTYIYDDYNRALRRIDGAGTHIFAYDNDSRLTSADGPWANDTITFQYDQLGRRSSLAVEEGQSVGYKYDNFNRLTEITAGLKTHKYQYSGANPLVRTLLRPNGSKTIYQYDSLKRLGLISHRNASNAVINEYGYTYNEQDLRSAETRTDGDPAFTVQNGFTLYENNDLNQLVHATSPERSFLYDDDGNMTQGYTPGGYQFQAAYDGENRLKTLQYTGAGGVAVKFQYIYSGSGALLQVKRYENNVLVSDTRNVGGGFLPLQERDGNNTVQRQYTWGLNMGGGIGGLLDLAQGGQDYSYLYDGRGNVSGLLDSSRAVAAAYSYDGYGNIIAKTGSLDQPFKFSTKAYEERTGLSYYGFRFYSAGLGRWVTRDPLGEAGGVNLYGFVNNDPLNGLDSFGLYNYYKGALGVGMALYGTLSLAANASIIVGGVILSGTGAGAVVGPLGIVMGLAGIPLSINTLHNAESLLREARKDSEYIPWVNEESPCPRGTPSPVEIPSTWNDPLFRNRLLKSPLELMLENNLLATGELSNPKASSNQELRMPSAFTPIPGQ
ncbi:MAG: RHS repeat-associated core domain-containing protein [Syntrophobacteraceae bacterium]